MGVIRLILAFAVVMGHNSSVLGEPFLRPEMAVELFFVISGFYMALVLNTKYENTKVGNSRFALNRVLKLYPAYFVALIIALIAREQTWVSAAGSLMPLTIIFLVAVNILILGTDLALFLGIGDRGQVYFTKNFSLEKVAAERFVMVGPAWSISAELIFYALSVLMLRWRVICILPFILASVSLKIFLFREGYVLPPWNYMFWPAELFCFLLGAVSCRALYLNESPRFRRLKIFANGPSASMVFGFTLMFLLFHNKFAELFAPHGVYGLRYQLLTIVLMALTIPVIFKKFKSSKPDRFLADFSYPIYILHAPLLFVFMKFQGQWIAKFGQMLTAAAYLSTLFILSYVVQKGIEEPASRLKKV